MSRGLRLFAALILAAGPAWAGEEGTTALPLLEMQQGARPTGMAGAFTAVADDINAIWWNPAGMARSKMTELTFAHTLFVEDLKTEYFAMSRPLPALKGTVGGSISYMTVPGIEGYDSTGRSVGNLTANSYAASLGYAGFLIPGELSFGFNGKYLGQTLTTQKGSGLAVDLGIQYRKEKLGGGVAVQNVGPSFKIGNDTNPLPTTIRAGLAYHFNPIFLTALDISKGRGSTALPHLGAEFRLTPNFHLRGGWQKQENLGNGAGMSFGFSLMGALGGSLVGGDNWGGEGTPWWEKATAAAAGLVGSFDYSFMSLGDLNDVHRLSLTLKF
ncbi:MAG: PorV/PorQ family protein [Elusimicrobia bacterium]|nr:PorV/PorQ family protein [Elusimicrobiota bacterium]